MLTNTRFPFFKSRLNNLPLYVYVCLYVYTLSSFFILTYNEYLYYFLILTTVDNATVNVSVSLSLGY